MDMISPALRPEPACASLRGKDFSKSLRSGDIFSKGIRTTDELIPNYHSMTDESILNYY
jgi:hypothetical protein